MRNFARSFSYRSARAREGIAAPMNMRAEVPTHDVRCSYRHRRIILLRSFPLPARTLMYTVQATTALCGENREPGVVRHARLANHKQLLGS